MASPIKTAKLFTFNYSCLILCFTSQIILNTFITYSDSLNDEVILKLGVLVYTVQQSGYQLFMIICYFNIIYGNGIILKYLPTIINYICTVSSNT